MSTMISVKELAYFVCQSGDLTNEFFSNKDQETGKKIHQKHQSSYNKESLKEVYVKSDITFENESYTLHGFIDGVLNIDGETIIEEIKSTSLELDSITIDYHKEHLAQLKIYAYLYGIIHGLDTIHTRLTYIDVVDYALKSFDKVYEVDELEVFLFSILEEYIKWLKLLKESQINKEKTLAQIKFPFKEKREGQQKLIKAVYQALNNKEILYAIAPTGIGKTMATLFASLKTLKDKDKLFYLTAKGSGKNAPLDAVTLLAKNGLKMKSIDITAKRKICNCKKKICNSEECPYAIGYFDRLKTATFEIFKEHDIFSADVITQVSEKHMICAFEFSLYLSYFCDLVIADYNYVFDPKAHLIRYCDDDTYKPKVLVDEAHNLVSRSKDMYSSSISELDIRVLRSKLNGYKPSIRRYCNKALEIFDSYKEYLEANTSYIDLEPHVELNSILTTITLKCDEIFEENKKFKNKDEALDIYFKIKDFLRISEFYGETHRLIAKLEGENTNITYHCLDASKFILKTINESIHGITFFSATLYPIDYYINLITNGRGKFIELASPFDPNNLQILINNSISTKYKDREASIDTIIESIETLVSRGGNYIVFFPSYAYMKMILDNLGDVDFECIIQENDLTEEDKEEIINKFKNTNNNKVGFFVMGGVFSEGIDFIGNALSGVIIIGVGLPLVCDENNLLKDFFEEKYGFGFDYAYTYPGFSKVIQAVGRVIRDFTDKGVAILIDERFTYQKYLQLMPPHWKNKTIINSNYKLKRILNTK